MGNTPTTNFGILKPAAGDINWDNEYAAFADLVDSRLMMTGHKNAVINGNFDIWQRGTSFSAPNNAYTADRMIVSTGGSSSGDTISRQSFAVGQIDVPNNPKYYYEFVADSVSANRVSTQYISDVRIASNSIMTVSGWCKSSVNLTGSFELNQNFGSGGSAPINIPSQSFNTTPTWTKFAKTFSVPSISGKTIGADSYLGVSFIRFVNISNVTISFSQLQAEIGSVATNFEFEGASETLIKCQPYYAKTFDQSTAPAQNAGITGALTTQTTSIGDYAFPWKFPVTMRKIPSIVLYNPLAVNSSARNENDNTDTASTARHTGDQGTTIKTTAAPNASDANDQMAIHATADAEIF